jgi:hypothetical protein
MKHIQIVVLRPLKFDAEDFDLSRLVFTNQDQNHTGDELASKLFRLFSFLITGIPLRTLGIKNIAN